MCCACYQVKYGDPLAFVLKAASSPRPDFPEVNIELVFRVLTDSHYRSAVCA